MVKAAEKTVAAMAVFPFSTVLNVLAPLLQTSQYPSLQATIKMVTKMVEVHPNEVTDDHLASIMPGLIKVSEVWSSKVAGKQGSGGKVVWVAS